MEATTVMRRCAHCKGDVEVRNPSGFCDHLYYPEYCAECRKAAHKASQRLRRARRA